MSNRYPRSHSNVRRRLAPFVDAGLADCARCGKPIVAGSEWDLGHVDGDPTRYGGPEHRKCNRATSRHAKLRDLGVSRQW